MPPELTQWLGLLVQPALILGGGALLLLAASPKRQGADPEQGAPTRA